MKSLSNPYLSTDAQKQHKASHAPPSELRNGKKSLAAYEWKMTKTIAIPS